MKIKYKISDIPFKHPFTISKGSKTNQKSFLVEIEFMGVRGYGEAPEISYYNIPAEKMISDLEEKMFFFDKAAFSTPERFWHYNYHIFSENTFLMAALDIAGWDLYGKMVGKQIRHIWNLDITNNPPTDVTIGIDNMENMATRIKETPWPVYKIKLGTDHDADIIRQLRETTDAPFRIDANGAWTVEEALKTINAVRDLNIEFVEQPLKRDDWEGMKVLYEKSPLPLIADESCVREEDVLKCRNHFHGINIKLTKCGGLTPARRMISNARKLNMKVMIGSMNEGSIGTSALTHILPLADYADIDGPLLLAGDNAQGLRFDAGRVIYNEEPGLGIKVEPF